MRRMAALALGGLLVASCQLGGKKSKGVKYEDSSFGITLNLPAGWEQTNKEEDEDVITVEFKKGDLDAMLMYGEVPGLQEAMDLLGPEFFGEMIKEAMAGEFDVTQTLSEGPMTVAGVQGHQVTFTGTVEGSSGVAQAIILPSGDKLVMVFFVREEKDQFGSKDKDAMKEFLSNLTIC